MTSKFLQNRIIDMLIQQLIGAIVLFAFAHLGNY